MLRESLKKCFSFDWNFKELKKILFSHEMLLDWDNKNEQVNHSHTYWKWIKETIVNVILKKRKLNDNKISRLWLISFTENVFFNSILIWSFDMGVFRFQSFMHNLISWKSRFFKICGFKGVINLGWNFNLNNIHDPHSGDELRGVLQLVMRSYEKQKKMISTST